MFSRNAIGETQILARAQSDPIARWQRCIPGLQLAVTCHHTLAACGCLAGSWTPWRAVRGPKSAPIEGEHELFGFLTTEPNAVVAPIHPKAMPVILTTAAEVDLWLAADAPKALELQRPLPDDALRIVASGEKEDRAAVLV
jgi:putative SOS response-associated peptidase YedK